VWQTDSRGGLNPMRQYRKKGNISSLVFCVFPQRLPEFSNANNAAGAVVPAAGGAAGPTGAGPGAAKGSKPDTKVQATAPSFFFGTDRGSLVYADDLGHCTDVQQLSAPIDTILYFEERSRLVIITRTLLLTQYHVSDDGRVSRVAQVKLSVPQDVAVKGIQSICWSGPGLLASDESYNLSMNNALGKLMDRSDRVVCVTFSPVDRYLAVGTQLGIVAIWRFTGQPRDVSQSAGKMVTTTAASDWEVRDELCCGASFCVSVVSA
jgi:hypothetical protein